MYRLDGASGTLVPTGSNINLCCPPWTVDTDEACRLWVCLNDKNDPVKCYDLRTDQVSLMLMAFFFVKVHYDSLLYHKHCSSKFVSLLSFLIIFMLHPCLLCVARLATPLVQSHPL